LSRHFDIFHAGVRQIEQRVGKELSTVEAPLSPIDSIVSLKSLSPAQPANGTHKIRAF
jgi:hypothetical protein